MSDGDKESGRVVGLKASVAPSSGSAAGNFDPQQRDGRIDGIDEGTTESLWVSQQLGRPVIKAFNNIYAGHLLKKGQPARTPGRIALALGGG